MLEQTAPGEFERRVIERGQPDHVCCVLGDWRSDGKIGLITGNFALPRATSGRTAKRPMITIWESRSAEPTDE
jgi:hypothetical protein